MRAKRLIPSRILQETNGNNSKGTDGKRQLAICNLENIEDRQQPIEAISAVK